MKKTMLTLTLFAASLLSVQAQDSTALVQETSSEAVSYNKEHFLGINTGSTTGLGFSYRQVYKKNGFQITGLPIYNDGVSFISIGAAYTHRPFRIQNNDDKLQFLIYAGVHAILFDGGDDIFVGTAPGIGLERRIGKRLMFQFMAGYAMYYVEGDLSTMLSGEIGLHYRIK